MKQRLINFGAACRRIVLLLSFFLVAAGAWFYWNGPGLDEFRPRIQVLLRNSLDLKQLSFGRLSWSWAGHVRVTARDLALVTRNDELRIKHAVLVVQVAVWPLLSGHFQVSAIRVLHPKIQLRIPEQWRKSSVASAVLVQVEDAEFTWKYGSESGTIPDLNVSLNAQDRELLVQAPGIRGRFGWTEDNAPHLLEWQWQGLDWLPGKFRQQIRGTLSGEVRMSRTKEGHWNTEISINGKARAAVIDTHGASLLPFKDMHLLADVYWPEFPRGLKSVHLSELSWQSGQNHLSLNGQWEAGRMLLQLKGGDIDLPVIRPWIRDLGEDDWQTWLADMRAGKASHLHGRISIDWPELWRLPTVSDLEHASYSLQADVKDAVIGLTPGVDHLSAVQGEIKLNQKGLKANVITASLPQDAGKVQGIFRIVDWNQITFDIKGHAKVDLASLLAWRGIKGIDGLQWLQAPASGDFAFTWAPDEAKPRQGSAHLIPASTWKLAYHDFQVFLSDGALDWNLRKDIHIPKMHVRSGDWQGILNLYAVSQNNDDWALMKLNLDGQAGLSALSQTYKIPVAEPAGHVKGRLSFDGVWAAAIDFKDASWDRWLGSRKAQGRSFTASAIVVRKGKSFQLNKLVSTGGVMQFHGYGEYGPKKKFILLEKLKTPAIDARVRLTEIDRDKPMELTIDGKYLTSRFLPKSTPSMSDLNGRKLLIRLFLEQLNWGGASLKGVQAKISMPGRSVDHLSAKKMSVADLTISDVNVLFQRTSANDLDVHRLSARLWGQNFLVSAIVSMQRQGGLRWRGFAQILSDDFSQLITELHWSNRFQGGKLQSLFAGQGTLMPGKPWWSMISGRLRLRVNGGRFLEGGTLTRLLAVASLADLPKLLIARRKDLVGPGIYYKRLQVEATLTGKEARLQKVALRSTAFDLAGSGKIDLQFGLIDLMTVIQPFQNLDAIIGAIPLLRDVLGGGIMRKVYHVHGPLSDAKVDSIDPKKAGFTSPGIWENLMSMPTKWFGKESNGKPQPGKAGTKQD